MKKTLLGKGTTAPEFRLRDQNGSWVTLADVLTQGPAVLVFYPGDNTPGCTIQLNQFREEASAFERDGVKVIGINPGPVDAHANFAQKLSLPFLLLSDPNGKVSKSYGALLDFSVLKIVQRTVYGIDPARVIRYGRRGMPKPNEVLRALKPFINQKAA